MSEFGNRWGACCISLGSKFVHYRMNNAGRLDGCGGNVRQRRNNRPARLITPERVGRRRPPAASATSLDVWALNKWENFYGCRYTGTNNWSSVQRENSKAFVNKQSNEIRELLIMLYNITDILIISTCVTFLSQCLLYKTICHLCIFFATMKYLKIVIFF